MEVGSILSYHEESYEDLRQKLLVATMELENMKKGKRELVGLLEMAYKERNEAREELQNLMNNLMLIPSISNHFKKPSFQVHQPENLVMMLHATTTTTTKANSTNITESNNSFSHVSSPIETNNNVVVVESDNFGGYLNNHQPLVHHGFNEKHCSDVANDVIDFLSQGKVLPQQGKLLDAVIDAGPLLQTLLVAGPIPTWNNPPPTLTVTPGIELNSFANNFNPFHKPTLVTSPSVFNFADNFYASFNNTL